MFQVRLLDKAAYQIAVEALDAFKAGDPRLLAPLAERCLAQLRSQPADSQRLWEESNEIYADMLEKAMASRDMEGLAHIVVACTAMPDYQSMLADNDKDSPNLVELTDARLYSELMDIAPWVDRLVIERFHHDCAPYAEGMSMFLFRREDLLRLQETLRKVVPGPSSFAGLGEVRDRFLDLIAKCLADERTALALTQH